jgi:glucan biosynthesis protein C
VGLLTLSFNRKPPYVVPPMGIYQAWKIAVFPVMQLWFLEALFLIFIATTLLEWTKCLDRKWRWFVVLGLASLLAFLTLPGMPEGVRWPFSLDGFFFLLPYFLFGMGLCRFKKSWQAPWILVTAIALALVGLVLQILIVLGRMTIPHIRGTPFFLCLSLTYIFLLFKIHWKVAWLARLGGFSYSIFLFHIYAIFAVGIILSLSRISLAPAWKFGILLVAGLSLPILVDVLLRPFALTRKLFLGLR